MEGEATSPLPTVQSLVTSQRAERVTPRHNCKALHGAAQHAAAAPRASCCLSGAQGARSLSTWLESAFG